MLRTFKCSNKGFASARNAAFDRADCAAAYAGGLFAREAAGTDEDQRLALFVGQAAHRARKILQIKVRGLRALGRRCMGGDAFVPRTLTPAATPDRVEVVAEDHKEPGFEICASLERRRALPRLHKGFLAKIIGFVPIATEGSCERAKKRDEVQQLSSKLGVVVRRLGRVRATADGLGHIHGVTLRAFCRFASANRENHRGRVRVRRRRTCAEARVRWLAGELEARFVFRDSSPFSSPAWQTERCLFPSGIPQTPAFSREIPWSSYARSGCGLDA